MHVLACDSERLRLVSLAQNLQNLGLECTTVTTVDAVIRAIKKQPCDLIILDSTAAKALERLKKADSTIPIIIIADRNKGADFERFIYDGIEGLILRPYRAEFFRKVIEKALQNRESVIASLKTVTSLKQKINELQTLNEMVQAINSTQQPKDVLCTIMDKSADLIRAEGWSVLLVDEERQELVFEAVAGEAGKKLLGMRLKIGQGVAGWVARFGQSLIVPDVTQDPRFYSGVDKKTKFTTKSILCVPMKSRDKIIGVVEVVNKIGGESFTQDDLEIFENLVAHITIALENAAIYRKMEQATLVDDLTQLYNTRYCNQFLDTFLHERKSDRGVISLIFLDIDFFKLVDDNFGHLVGSETLKYVGERIRRVVRTCDVVARYGGDEYIVCLPNADKKTAALIAERIRREIGREPFYAFGDKKFSITVTLGIATYPEDARTRDELIGKADKAMYEGKLSGRNKVVLS